MGTDVKSGTDVPFWTVSGSVIATSVNPGGALECGAVDDCSGSGAATGSGVAAAAGLREPTKTPQV